MKRHYFGIMFKTKVSPDHLSEASIGVRYISQAYQACVANSEEHQAVQPEAEERRLSYLLHPLVLVAKS
jgi:hypothetical protein